MAKVEVTMPKMGESITEGTVIVWHKQPGDTVELDETLLEIGTDKVDTEVPSPAAGVLKEILVPEGDTVEVNTAIAIIETEAEASGSDEPTDAPSDEGEAEAEAETAEAVDEEAPEEIRMEAGAEEEAAPETEQHPESSPASASPGGGATTEVVMPKMGESITEGTVIVWHKQPGDTVELDETLLEIGTDKVDTEVPSPAAGVLKEILVEEGATVEVGTTIAIIAAEAGAEAASTPSTPEPAAEPSGNGEQAAAQEPTTAQEKPAQPSGDGAVMEPQTQDAGPISRHTDDGRFISPLVRSIAETEGLSMSELAQIDGSGREGRITKQDVMSYLANRSVSKPAAPAQSNQPAPQRPAQPAPRPMTQPVQSTQGTDEDGERVEIIEMDRMRQIIADHMVRSKATSAHVTSFAEADVTNLVKLRENNKRAFFEREGIKLTYTPFFVHAAVEALADHPILNASVDGKRIVIKKDYHIGIAVAIEKAGLIVPVIRNAGRQNVVGLAHSASDLAQRARSKQLQPDDLQGGTFTVTNVGSLGSIMGTPIIPQPQVAIIATGAIKKRPVVVETSLGDVIAIRHMMYLSLSYDHRIIDGAMGVSFLRRFVEVIEGIDPEMEI